jgi:hypothetical protein
MLTDASCAGRKLQGRSLGDSAFADLDPRPAGQSVSWLKKTMDEEQAQDAAAVAAVWEIRHDEASGQAYYWNASTGETSWDPPAHLATAEEIPGAVNTADPWTQAYDDDGRVFFLNTDTMETRWAPPPMADEHQEDVSLSSDPDAIAATYEKARRPSTAEQMDRLNRLLSGEGEDEEEGSPEIAANGADHAEEHDTPPPVSGEQTEKPAVIDAEACPWMMFVNEDDGVPYYYNHITGECLWDPPEEFVRFHQELPQPPAEDVDRSALTSPEAESSTLATAQDSALGSDGVAELQSEAGSAANSARLSDAGMQPVVTPEFEEKVRQAIAAASDTPASSSRLVLVRTPTQEQLAPRTGRSSRSGSNSARPRSGPSRPSSAGAISRPRTPSIGATSSERDQVLPTTDQFSLVEEEMPTNAVEDDPQGEADMVAADEISTPKHNDDEVLLPLSIQASSTEESEATDHVGVVDTDEGNKSVVAATTEAEAGEATFQGETESLVTEEPHSGSEAALEEANRSGTWLEGLDDAANEANVDGAADVETEAAIAETFVDLSNPAHIQKSVEVAALVLQCMARCFIARQRVTHKRGARHKSSIPMDTTSEIIETAAAVHSDVPPEAEERAATFPPCVLVQDGPNGEDPRDSVLVPASLDEDAVSQGDLLAVPSLDTETPRISADSDVTNAGSVDTPPSEHQTVPPAQSSKRLSVGTPAQEQHPRQDRVPVSTRLPSVLDVTKYFSQRRTMPSRLGHAGSSANASGLTAITRKKVDIGSPPRHRRASQQEAERIQAEHEQRLESRRQEEERVQRAQVVEYQRVYADSRKAFEAEKQRLLDEKLARDNQRDHDAQEEKQARVRERDATRERHKIAGNEADRLVWEHLKTQGRPTEQSVRQFREALAQALDAAHFPSKICAERARELHERIERLHRASWAVDSRLEAVELALLSELHPLTDHQRPLQAKYAAKLRCRLERILSTAQSWQRVLDEWEVGKEDGSTSRYWATIQARYAPSSATYTSDESRRQYVLNAWRGAAGGDSVLHVAAWNGWEEHVRLLIEEGADVNLVDSSVSRRTPLHEACRAGHVPIVEQLLRSGARLSAVDASGDSPLHVACRGGWTRVIRILLIAANDLGEEADPSSLDEEAPLTLEEFFNLRNGKERRAIDVVTLPSLMEELKSTLASSKYCGLVC